MFREIYVNQVEGWLIIYGHLGRGLELRDEFGAII